MKAHNQSWEKDKFLVSTDKSLLQISSIHKFLSTEAYWSLDIPKEVVARSIENSLCFGLYVRSNDSLEQIGYARIVTDYASFAWLCDVYIENKYRNLGLSKYLLECIMSHSALKGLRRICLATKDAHELYKKFGFEVTQAPKNWMEIKDPNIYKNTSQFNV